jgi:serine/threonine protein kinase
VVHRDIKLENILLDSHAAMKIIDFGLAAFYQTGKKLRVHCGSPSYAAPEIVARRLYEGPPVDVWSLGVVTFAMVAGYLPFHASNGNKQVRRLGCDHAQCSLAGGCKCIGCSAAALVRGVGRSGAAGVTVRWAWPG